MVKSYFVLLFNLSISIGVTGQNTDTHTQNNYRRSGHLTNLQNTALNSIETGKQKLDSIINYNFDDASGTWTKKFTKASFEYDSEFNEILYTLSGWDNSSQSWKEHWKETTSYDGQGNRSTHTRYTWSVDDRWQPMSREQFVFNDENTLKEAIKYTWKISINDWVLTDKTTYAYNDDGKPERLEHYTRTSSETWQLFKKIEYSYREGYPHEIITYLMDNNTGQWQVGNRTSYIYNWTNASYTVLEEDWDGTSEKWVKTKYTAYLLNDDDELVSKTIVEWGEDRQRQIFKELYTFDYTINYDQLILPFLQTDEKDAFHHKVLTKELSSHDSELNDYKQYRQMEYHYSSVDLITEIEKPIDESIYVYPNPTYDYITFSYPARFGMAELTLYDGNGKRLYSKDIYPNERLDISDVQPGIYIYSLLLGDKLSNGKISKK